MKKLLTLIFSLLFIFVLAGCNNKFDPFKSVISGDFIYTHLDSDEGHCRIIGLSEEGNRKEVVVFPSILDGYIVDGLGASWAYGKSSGEIIITNAKKIYFPSDYTLFVPLNLESNHNNEEIKVYIVEIDFINYYYYMDISQENIGWNNLFVTEIVFDIFYSEYNEDVMKLEKANVVYYVDDKPYFIDDCDGTLTNAIPPTPYKEGYEFIGWYKEQECLNKWNFERDIIAKKEYDNEGNYIFKETRIYAKWEKFN